MNSNQKVLLVTGGLLAILALVYPPFEYTYSSTYLSSTTTRGYQGREFILIQPAHPTGIGSSSNTRALLYGELAVTLLAIAVATGVGLVIDHAPPAKIEPPKLSPPSTAK
jgi:hypothetical protein